MTKITIIFKNALIIKGIFSLSMALKSWFPHGESFYNWIGSVEIIQY